MTRQRLAVLATVAAVAVVLAAVALIAGVRGGEQVRKPASGPRLDRVLPAAQVRSGPNIVFRSTVHGPTYGQLGIVALDDPAGPRALLPLKCLRVYATRAAGVCLTDRGNVTGYRVLLLDAALSPRRELPLPGNPSRARLSPDSALAATTSFVEGHSYAQGGFSTETILEDLRSGRSLVNLETFAVFISGRRYRAVDLNVWGVTFVDGNRFYATVGSGAQTWLAEGNVAHRRLTALRAGVECPSLSPDRTRIAYKWRTGNDPRTWRLHVLNLRTGRDVALAETRSVDDQAEWLDDNRVLYALPRKTGDETDVWAVPADGSGRPQVFVPRAWSPAVVR